MVLWPRPGIRTPSWEAAGPSSSFIICFFLSFFHLFLTLHSQEVHFQVSPHLPLIISTISSFPTSQVLPPCCRIIHLRGCTLPYCRAFSYPLALLPPIPALLLQLWFGMEGNAMLMGVSLHPSARQVDRAFVNDSDKH